MHRADSRPATRLIRIGATPRTVMISIARTRVDRQETTDEMEAIPGRLARSGSNPLPRLGPNGQGRARRIVGR